MKDAYEMLAKAMHERKAGRHAKAVRICERLIEEYPDYVAALHTLGLSHMAQQNFWPALSCFVRAAMLNPRDWTILTSLAQCYIELDAKEMAAQTLERAIAINPDTADVHFTLGVIYEREREYEAAVDALRRALELKPDHWMAANMLGSCLVHLGQVTEAAEAFQTAHAAEPQNLGPIHALAQLPEGLSDIDIGAVHKAVEPDPTVSKEDFEIRKAFALAFHHHQQGAHDTAWEQLRKANAPLKQRYRAQMESRRVYRRTAMDNATRISLGDGSRRLRDDVPVSLFVLGVSRSGKTTLERALAALPGVKRGYENPIVELAVRRTSQQAGLLTASSLFDLPIELSGEFSANYLDELNARAAGVKVFANTHPGRLADVGLLAKLVPNARFMFIVRNREDTALRILMKQYKEGTNVYAYDLADAFDEIDWYHDLMGKWQEALPQLCRTIAYEDVVADTSLAKSMAEELCELSPSERELPPFPDDRGCAKPYREFMKS